MAASGTVDLDGLDFDRMASVHRRAARGYRLYAAALLCVGGVLLGLALFQQLPWLPALVVGLLACALAVLPARQAVERGERIEGLVVLRDEWRELTGSGGVSDAECERFYGLMRRLYDGRDKQD